jgi:hypothetical protein
MEMTYIVEKIIKLKVGPKGYPAFKSNTDKCKHCNHDEFETFRGAGVTEIYCCKCEKFTDGG